MTNSIPFWLVSTFEYENIDELGGEVEFKTYSKWWWLSSEELTTKTNDAGGAFFKDETKSDCFPVNPSLPFLNLIVIDNIGQLAKAESKELPQPIGEKKFLNFSQKVFRVKLSSKLEMRRYPFDRHLVPAILAVRQWKTYEGTEKTKHAWKLLPERPDEWFGGDKGYSEDRHTVNLVNTWTDQHDELKKLTPEVRMKGKPTLCLKLERDPTPFYLNIALPTFVTVMIVILSFFSINGASITSVATGILTLMASQNALQAKLPKTVYITYAGIYLLVTYTFLLSLGIGLTLVERIKNDKDVDIVDYNSGLWFISSFAVLWIVIHLFMLLDGIGDLVGSGFLRAMFRVSWKDIVVPEHTIKNGKLGHN